MRSTTFVDPPAKKAWTTPSPFGNSVIVKDLPPPSAPPEIDKTGKTEVVAGYKCEI